MSEAPAADGHRDGGHPTGDLFEWRCPLCGQTGPVLATEGHRHAVESLRSHVRSSDDELHGPVTTMPDDLENESLARYVG